MLKWRGSFRIVAGMTDVVVPGLPAVDEAKLSPAMRQYVQIKKAHPGYVVFFRMGDFYELFWEDARVAARVLGIVLSTRSRGGLDDADAIPMAGVPFHSVDGYLRKMIGAGYKVALCEQTEEASQAKGVIKRDVARLMTPGTLTDDPLLDGRAENFLAAVAVGMTKKGGYQTGIAWVDLSTGAVFAASGPERAMLDELARLRPAEVLVPELPSGQAHDIAGRIGGTAKTLRPGWQFSAQHAAETLKKQWGVTTTAGFGFEADEPGPCAIAAVVSYLEETQRAAVPHLLLPRRHRVEDHLVIDPASWRSLEIDRTVRSGGTEGSLLSAVDQTSTTMGARLLRQWLRYPLTDVEHIVARQESIAALLANPAAAREVAEMLSAVCDVERVVARLAVNRALPRDLAALARTLAGIPPAVERLRGLGAAMELFDELSGLTAPAQEVGQYLRAAILPEPAANLREGGVIAGGFDAELDRLRVIGNDSQSWLAGYQSRLAAETQINSLKVSYNKVFGYYIEVTDVHREKVPAAWTRRQTVRNAERYITEELKKFEEEALGASERALALEQALFERVRQWLLPKTAVLQDIAGALARLDVLAGLAKLAGREHYCRPAVVAGRVLEIIEGRHAVLSQQLGSQFVANDAKFGDGDTLQLITGPNMAGKSTFIRQVALIVLLAQVGSYVPAKSCTVGVADRLFTRIGASDELHEGQSTFMVEMLETANILNSATDRSLVVLDEIGRGTSTLDGLSLAWAIAEHIAADVKCRTLFATHYHELTDLAQRFRGVKNLNVAVREWGEQVIFLHRIVEGSADRSYGIHVARMAGVPQAVIERAKQLLGELSVQQGPKARISKSRRAEDMAQLQLFADPITEFRRELGGTDLDGLSPMAALEMLQKLKRELGK
jgi:DNA mismatch repair protein MutS